jgi:hypothetical protein
MNPEWLCYVNGQEYGPYTWPQLVQMAASGNIVPQTYVRRNFDSQWYLAEQVPGLFAPAGAPTPKQAAHPPRPAAAKPAAKKSGSHPVVAAKPAAPVPVATPQPQPALAPPITPQGYVAPQAGMHAVHPVTQPVQPAVPKGRVVSSRGTTPSPPQGTTPNWIPTSPTAVSPASATPLKSTTDDEVVGPIKKDNSKTMVLALGGAICAVAILGGAAILWKMTRKPETPKEIAATVEISETENDPSIADEPENLAAETDPTASEEPKKPGAKAASEPPTTTTSGTKQGPTAPAANAVLKIVKTWRPIERFGTVGTRGGLTCTKLTAYLAADAAGRKVTVLAQSSPAAGTAASVAPNTDGNATSPPGIVVPASDGSTRFVSAEAAPYLFVEMTIKNTDTKPLVYSGWNNSATAAVLVDAAGNTLELVASSATPNVARHISKEIPPGDTVQDTLVFAVPPATELGFKLVLPQPAFSAALKGAWGYEISGAALAAAGSPVASNPANPQGTPLVPRSSVAVPIPGLHDEPAPQPAPPSVPEKSAEMTEPEKKSMPSERIPIPGLQDTPEVKPAGPSKPEEVPNLAPPQKAAK